MSIGINHFVYLDNNATTPCDPRVVEAMVPYFHDMPGNAASRTHPFGWKADEAVSFARENIAELIQVDPKELVFTSGATESDNLALKGVFYKYAGKGNHIITCKAEHNAVLDPCEYIEKTGGKVTYLDVNKEGLIDPDELAKAITPETILVSVMYANNETGVIQPMQEIGEICQKNNVLLMCDATQAVGKIKVNPKEVGIHIMAFSAHKMYGPKGVGALYVSQKNPRIKLTPLLHGGGHENGMRSGTLNVPGIVGFGRAAMIAMSEMQDDANRLMKWRDQLESTLLKNIEESFVNGSTSYRLPHVSNMSFKYVDGENLMMTFNQHMAISSGSACTSASLDPSHVLLAMGLDEDLAHSSVRFSLGKFNTEKDIEFAISAVTNGVEHLRSMSPVWEMYKDGMLQE